jgi:pimeloyl-ACP methyl ester carboxylesterase
MLEGPEQMKGAMAVAEILKVLLPLVIIGLALVYYFQDALIFFPQSVPPENRTRFAAYGVEVRHEGRMLHGWFVPGVVSATQPLVIYYGGNAEEVSGNLWDRAQLKAGASLFMNYAGYGDSQGKPTQARLCQDALFILDWICRREAVPPAHVVLMGRSLGSGVAVFVASRRPVGGIVLVTPFDSLLNVARHHYPFLPVRLLLKYPFDSAALAPSIKMPALVLTAAQDTIVPGSLATNLARVWGGPVQTVTIAGAGHNDIQLDPRYWEAVNAYLMDLSRHKSS